MAYRDIQLTHNNGYSVYNTGVLRINYTVTQNAVSNYSTVTIGSIAFWSQYSSNCWFYADGVVSFAVNGSSKGSVTYSNNGYSDGCFVQYTYTEYTLGSKSMPSAFTVNHDSNGNGAFTVTLSPRGTTGYSDFNIFCAAGNAGSAESDRTQTFTVSLPQIDRTEPTVSLSASAATATSISISGSANVNCDIWQYSVDGGSWTNFSTTNSATASGTITGLTAGTHTVQIRARKTYNNLYGSSSSASVDTSPPTVTVSISDVTSSGMSVAASANVTCDLWEYTTNGGSTWTQYSVASGTSASFTLSNLSPNTQYTIYVRARKASNSIKGTSAAATATTLGSSLLHSVANVTMDDASPAASFVATIYGSFYHAFKIYAEDGTTPIYMLLFSSLTTGSQKTYTFHYGATPRSTLLNTFPNAKTCVFKVVLETYTDSTRATLVGTSEMRSFTASTTAANSAPTFTGFTYEDTETETVDATGDDQILIQSYSHLEVTAAAGTAKNGASISGYSVNIGDKSLSGSSTSLDVGEVNSSGSLSLTVTCSDSRGYSTSVTQTVTVLPYAKPRFNTYTLRRRNEIDKLVQLHFSGSISSIMPSSTERNSVVSVSFKYKLTSAAESAYISVDLTNDPDMTINGLSFSFGTDELMELDETLSYDFVFYVYDELGSLSVFEYHDILNQGTPLLSFRKRSVLHPTPRIGVNNPMPVHELDVHGDIAMHDVIVQGFVAELDDEYLNNLTAGGYYMQLDTSKVLTNKNYPAASKPGLLEVLAGSSGAVIQRYTPFDLSAVYIRYYPGSGSWSNWGAI